MAAHSYLQHVRHTAHMSLLLLLSAPIALVHADRSPLTAAHIDASLNATIASALHALIAIPRALAFTVQRGVQRFFPVSQRLNPTFQSMLTSAIICGALPCIWLLRKRGRSDQRSIISSVQSISHAPDTASTDPGLLRKHSTWQSYTVNGITYPSIRTFYRPHPQGAKLPTTPRPIPLLVFIHGLGGSVAQFHPLMTSLVNAAPCLSIDLPGCGLSQFKPTAWSAYTTEAMVHLLAHVIEAHRERDLDQNVVLIGHSMGSSLAALLASKTSPYSRLLSDHVSGLIAICPQASPPEREQAEKFKKLLAIPGPIFDIWRRWDRRGGTESASVRRFVGEDAEQETKRLQVRFNEQSKTPVWRRMARGLMPDYSSGVAKGGIPGKEVWEGLELPLFLIAGEADLVTPAGELRKIVQYQGKAIAGTAEPPELVPDSAAPFDLKIQQDSTQRAAKQNLVSTGNLQERPDLESDGDSMTLNQTLRSNSTMSAADTARASGPTAAQFSEVEKSLPESFGSGRHLPLKTTILPAPASHGLLYAPATARILAGLIQSFLAEHIDHRLSLGWQLHHLSTEGKWDVKNLEKWQAVQPVSLPIANVFRAMKTLREVDERHCPKVFVAEWKGKIRAIVDISHESPVYDPQGLEAGGITYHKFPTVSKLPPSTDEVKNFIDLIDGLRAADEQHSAVQSNGNRKPLIGVHCHYGFNRTGFFIVCYLVERLGYKLQDAIDEFGRQRPPGIRHEHFIDTLYVRYCVGLRRAPTL